PLRTARGGAAPSWPGAAWPITSARGAARLGLGVAFLFCRDGFFFFPASPFPLGGCRQLRRRSHCATAAGRTAEEAIHSAHEIDCAMLSVDRDDNIICMDVRPSSVRALSGK